MMSVSRCSYIIFPTIGQHIFYIFSIFSMDATIKQLIKEKEQLEMQIEELLMQILCLDVDEEELERKKTQNLRRK